MKEKLKIIIIIIITFIIIAGFSKESNSTIDIENDSAKTVLENHFKYKNEKNNENLLTTLTERFNDPNVFWGFENLDSTKIISIEEENNEKLKEGYLINGRGKINGATKNNLKIYKVKFEVNYKKDGVGPRDSGIYDYWYFLIRKDETSPWLIDDMGV
ncbi:MAG: DUF4829 domain-containing protein [Clostridium sp.]|nr:DUF4829 domain-containing protein [Clostridium sp.]